MLEHQGSKRVGNPLRNRRGIFSLLLPVAFYWWLVVAGAAAVEFGAMIYDMSCMDCAWRGRGDGGSF